MEGCDPSELIHKSKYSHPSDEILIDQNHCFSNTFPIKYKHDAVNYIYDGTVFHTHETSSITFKSINQGIMWSKAIFCADFETATKILQIKDMTELETIKIKNCDETIWELFKYDIILTHCLEKFSQNKIIKEQLLAIRGKKLVLFGVESIMEKVLEEVRNIIYSDKMNEISKTKTEMGNDDREE